MPAPKTSTALALQWAALSFVLITGPLEAGEFCVACTGPVASYRCTFTGDGSSSQSPGLQLTCISELAKLGRHQSCTIERNRQSPCDATAKLFAAPEAFATPSPAGAKPAAAATPEEPQKKTVPADVPPADHAADPSAAPEEDPTPAAQAEGKIPRTVKEIVDKSAADTKESAEKAGAAVGGAAKSAGSAVEKAGAAIGTAAKKTWTCLTSLFGDC